MAELFKRIMTSTRLPLCLEKGGHLSPSQLGTGLPLCKADVLVRLESTMILVLKQYVINVSFDSIGTVIIMAFKFDMLQEVHSNIDNTSSSTAMKAPPPTNRHHCPMLPGTEADKLERATCILISELVPQHDESSGSGIEVESGNNSGFTGTGSLPPLYIDCYCSASDFITGP